MKITVKAPDPSFPYFLGDTSEEEKILGWDKTGSLSGIASVFYKCLKALLIHYSNCYASCSICGSSHFCQVLTIRQIYRISTMYWDDKYGTQSVSNEVRFFFFFSFLKNFFLFILSALNLFLSYLKMCSCRLFLKWGRSWIKILRIWHQIHSCWMMIWGKITWIFVLLKSNIFNSGVVFNNFLSIAWLLALPYHSQDLFNQFGCLILSLPRLTSKHLQ